MAAFLTGGCSEGEPFGHPSAEEKSRVEVCFRLEAVGTDVSLVPMTRATSYTQWFRNTARLLILKRRTPAGSWTRRKPSCSTHSRGHGPN